MTSNKKPSDLTFSNSGQNVIKDTFGFHLSSINMYLPSKYFMNPIGFCAAKTNVKRNQSKGNGLAFGVLGLFIMIFFPFPFFKFIF